MKRSIPAALATVLALAASPGADAAPPRPRKPAAQPNTTTSTAKKPRVRRRGKNGPIGGGPASGPAATGPAPAQGPGGVPPGTTNAGRPTVRKRTPTLQVSLRDKEVYSGSGDGTVRRRSMWLPGFKSKQLARYQVIDGLAVVEGDIVLGPESELSQLSPPQPPQTSAGDDAPEEDSRYATQRQGLGIHSDTSMYWEDATIPFELRSNLTNRDRADIAAAIQHLRDNTNIRLVPRNGHADYVAFKHKTNTCASQVGRQSGKQLIHLDACGMGSTVHEILHSAGVWHEQSRNDRADFVSINESNIRDDKECNFEKRDGEINDVGPYDYGSIMHYSRTAFGKRNSSGNGRKTTINIKKPFSGTIGQRSGLSPLDIQGLNTMYPVANEFKGGDGWGAGNYTTGVQFANVDSDAADEFIVVRHTDQNARVFVYDDAASGFAQLLAWQGGMPAGAYATDVAVGNVDNDARNEFGVTFQAPKGKKRVVVFDDKNASFAQLFNYGEHWGTGWSATAIAFGDIDADGRDEVLFGRRADKQGNNRWYIHDDAVAGFAGMEVEGNAWGDGNWVADIATGDVDGDGRDEIAMARRKSGNVYSLKIWTYNGGTFTTRHSLGANWGSSNYVTSVAFGDIDGDGRDEVAYGRKASSNHRWRVLDDGVANFVTMRDGGQGWGSSNYPTAVAFGDVDNDGHEELGMARKAGANSRYWVLDDAAHYFNPLVGFGGTTWGSSRYATSIAFGDVDNDGELEFGIGRKASANKRYAVYSVEN